MALLDLPAVAHIYRVPLGTLRRWLSEGKLTRHGPKPHKVDLEEVEALIAKRAGVAPNGK